jgi:hypothetical protein
LDHLKHIACKVLRRLLVNIVTDGEEALRGWVAVGDGTAEDIFCVLDQVWRDI